MFPIAEKIPCTVLFGKIPGELRGTDEQQDQLMDPPIGTLDNYHWLRDDSRTSPKVLQLIEDENNYTTALLSEHTELNSELYREIKSYVKEDYDTYAYAVRGAPSSYRYFIRYQANSDYKCFCRRDINNNDAATAVAAVDVLLDVNELAKGNLQCDVSDFSISPDHVYFSYGVDFDGSERYELIITDISDINHPTRLNVNFPKLAYCNYLWATESLVYYLVGDSKNRLCELWMCDIKSATHHQLFCETNEAFDISLGISSDRKYLFLTSGDYDSNFVQFIHLESSSTNLSILRPLEMNTKMSVDHCGGHFYILTNRDGAVNWKIMRCASHTSLSTGIWSDFIDYNPNQYISDMILFATHLVYTSKVCGNSFVNIVDYQREVIKVVNHVKNKTVSYTAHTVDTSLQQNNSSSSVIANVALAVNPCMSDSDASHIFSSNKLILSVTSMTCPLKLVEYDLHSLEHTLLYESVVPNYKEELYACERVWAPLPPLIDATVCAAGVPISMVYRKDLFKKDGSMPLYLYGYGSYGHIIEADFNYRLLPLLDRGYIFAIAHVRGGSFLGYDWYLDGKMFCKLNTFHDFIRSTEYLIAEKFCDPRLVTIEGRSAGGLLVGACLTMRPELFHTAVLGVPFVDVMNTMCDASIPLTTEEWTQWGNPNIEADYQYMLQYCPYSNINEDSEVKIDYPHMFLSAGLHDPRVQYWEPLKFLAKIRGCRDPASTKIQAIRVETTQGHFGGSSRYKYIEELAEKYTFVFTRK